MALLLSAAPWGQAADRAEVQVGERLGDSPMLGLNTRDKRLRDYSGKPLLINVWASWCGPCRREMASIERLARRHAGDGSFRVIGISIDDDRDAALRFLKASGVTFDNFIDQRLVLERMLGASKIPLTVLVDRDGSVIKKISGEREWDSPQSLNLLTHAFGLAR